TSFNKKLPATSLNQPPRTSATPPETFDAYVLGDHPAYADWVVLSPCNTAAGATEKRGAEALSGLASGRRATLVGGAALAHLLLAAARLQIVVQLTDKLLCCASAS